MRRENKIKSMKIKILFIAVVLFVASCGSKGTEHHPATKHAKPEIGMSYSDFQLTCAEKPDSTNSTESSAGSIINLRYENNDKNKVNDCWGSFTFVNGKLSIIQRN